MIVQDSGQSQPAPDSVIPNTAPVTTANEQVKAEPQTQPGKIAPKPWMEQLKGDLKTNEILSKFDTFSDVAEEFLKIEGKRDRLVEIPGTESDEATKKEFWKKLGVPEMADGYEFEKPALPDGLKYDSESEKSFKQLADKLKLSKAQAKALFEFDVQRNIGAITAQQKAVQEQATASLNALKKEWGDRFEENSTKAVETAKKLGTPELLKVLQSTGALGTPEVAKFFLELGNKIGDTGFVRGNAPAAPGASPLFDFSSIDLPKGLNPRR